MSIIKRYAIGLVVLAVSAVFVACAKEPETSIDKAETEPPVEAQESVEPVEDVKPQEAEEQQEIEEQPEESDEQPQQEEKIQEAKPEVQEQPTEPQQSTGGVDENGFPLNPKKGDTVIINGTKYAYNSALNIWGEDLGENEVKIIDNSDVDMTPLYDVGEEESTVEPQQSTGGVDEDGFPLNPYNEQIVEVDGKEYMYAQSIDLWVEYLGENKITVWENDGWEDSPQL